MIPVYLKTHIFYVVLIVLGAIAFRSWLSEHDARLQADQTAKVAEAQVKSLTDDNDSLRTQIATSDATAQKAITALKTAAAKVTTPQQAIAAIPDVSNVPLRAIASPLPNYVQVDALALYADLNQCQQDKLALDACSAARTADEKIISNDAEIVKQKDAEIVAYKKPKPFLHRVVSTLKIVSVGIGIGLILGGHL